MTTICYGATKIARPDITRPSELRGLTLRNCTTWHQIAGVDIAEPDNVAPPHRIARVQNARSDIAAPYSKGGHRETWQRGTRYVHSTVLQTEDYKQTDRQLMVTIPRFAL